jgi:ADP-ribose pyrophosphatase YjhB (NUDIX family)
MNDYVSSVRRYIGHNMLLLVGAGVFVHRDGKLLLQRRRDDGTWADHGGCLEIGETLEDAARREVKEETGLTAGELQFLCLCSGPDHLHTYPNGDRAYVVGAYYLCEDFTGTPIPQTDETTDLRWFALDDLPADTMPMCREALGKCLEVLRSRSKCFT